MIQNMQKLSTSMNTSLRKTSRLKKKKKNKKNSKPDGNKSMLNPQLEPINEER